MGARGLRLLGIGAFTLCCSLCALPETTAVSVGAVRSPQFWDADLFVSALPQHPVAEHIYTKNPGDIDVTVARLSSSKALHVSDTRRGVVERDLDPDARIVWHGVGHSTPANPLAHDVVLPPLPIGVYQVRFLGPGRTAIQQLNVTTLGVIVQRGKPDSVMLPIDLRTMRRRVDVTLDGSTPSPDGLIHFSAPSRGHVAIASDGSIAAIGPGWYLSLAARFHLATDRERYRAGDQVHFRYISETPSDDDFFEFNRNDASGDFWYAKWVHIENSTASGTFRLPLTIAPGSYDPNNIFVVAPPYTIDAAPLETQVTQGGDARFIVSAQGADGPARLRLHYAWHATALPDAFPLSMRMNDRYAGPLHEGDVTTNMRGNAVIVVPAATPDIEVYVYDPRTHALAAYARTHVIATPSPSIELWAPAPGPDRRCVPLGVRVTNAKGAPESGRHVHVVIRPATPYSDMTPNPALFTADLTTQLAGYGFTQWCARVAPHYWDVAMDAPGVGLQTQAPVFADPTGSPQPPVVLFTPLTAQTRPDSPAEMFVRSTTDADALVVSGSWGRYHSQVIRISGGVARFGIDPPADVDDFQAMLYVPGGATNSLSIANITVTPKRHLLHVRIGCAMRTYTAGSVLNACVHVTDWQGARVRARIFGELTQTTSAGIAAARARPNAAYDNLFGLVDPLRDFTTSWAFLGWLPKLELYPTPTPLPSSMPRATPLPANPTPTPRGPFPAPQTLAWIDGAKTDAAGAWHWRFTWPGAARPGLYLFHIIALADDGSVGEVWGALVTQARAPRSTADRLRATRR